MTTAFWLLTVLLLTVVTPLVVELTPDGRIAAQILFTITGLGVLISMMVLRFLQSRMIALNILLAIYAGAFAGACLFFGGADSPTYHLLIMVPAMAGLVGSISSQHHLGCDRARILAGRAAGRTHGIHIPADYRSGKPQHGHDALVQCHGGCRGEHHYNLRGNEQVLRGHSLQISNEELRHLSTHDQLTRLPNRRFYDERMGSALKRAADQDITGRLYCFWTWTISRRLTTPMATAPVTNC